MSDRMDAATQPSGAALQNMCQSKRKGEHCTGLCSWETCPRVAHEREMKGWVETWGRFLWPRSTSHCTILSPYGFFPPFHTPPWRCTWRERREAVIWGSWSSDQPASAKPSRSKHGKCLSVCEAFPSRKSKAARPTQSKELRVPGFLQTDVTMAQKKDWSLAEGRKNGWNIKTCLMYQGTNTYFCF